MIRFLLTALCLAGSVVCQTASASPFRPDFHGFTDSIPPVIICPLNQTVQLGPGQCEQIINYVVTATDDQPGVIVVQALGIASGATFSIGVTVNSFVALDAAGNTSTCSFTITVQDNGTVLSCKPAYTAQVDANCSFTLLSAELLNPLTGNCTGNFLVELDRVAPFGNGPWQPAVLTAADVNKTYQFRVSAYSGNRCFGNVTVKDFLAPQISCADIAVVCVVNNFTPTYLADSLGISAARPSTMDNCGGPLNATYLDNYTDLPCDSTNTAGSIISRRWTVTDGSNNLRTCVQKITIHRVRITDVLFPPDQLFSCTDTNFSVAANGAPFITFAGRNWSIYPSSSCSVATNFSDSIVTQCGGSKNIRRTWYVVDFCDFSATTSFLTSVQNLEVQDTGAPGIVCPPTTVVRMDTAGCQGKIKPPDAVVTDGCSGIAQFAADWTTGGGGQAIGRLSDWPGNNPLLRDTLGSLDSLTFPTGPTIIRYIATDACGNTGSCTFTLFVADTMPPTAICKPFLTVELSADGTFALRADSLDAGSSDACNPVFVKVRRELPGPCQANDQFYDAALFCCADIADTVTLRLRVYDAPPPAGTVPLAFDSAYSNECTMRVQVTDPQPLYCAAPPDVVVTCDSFDATLTAYGNLPVRSCKADSLQILLDYTQFDPDCRHGQIIRTFRVMDAAGNSAACTQRINVQNFQDYFVRFPNDVTTTTCPAFDYFGEPQLYNLDCERMEVTYTDEVYTVVEDACYKIERTWKILNRCQYDAAQTLTMVPNPNPSALSISAANLFGPVVSASNTTGPWAPSLVRVNPNDPAKTDFSTFWSDSTNGYQYTQIIKVIDGTDPVVDNCPITAPFFLDSTDNNPALWQETYWLDPTTGLHDLAETPVQLSVTAFDSCSGSDVVIRYLLFLDLDNNGTQETVINSNTANLPLAQQPAPGTLQYGNANNPNYTGGTARTYDQRLLPSVQKYRFALQTTISGHRQTASVRWNTQAAPSSYTNPQLPPGKHRIKWFVTDGCGNETSCQYNFTINDSLPNPLTTIGGTIRTELNVGVSNVQVDISATSPGTAPYISSVYSTAAGQYAFPQPFPTGTAYTLTPVKDGNALNGVTTSDLVLISQHILGLNLLHSPYKLIAADADKSNSITTTDILQLRKLILGIYENGLPNTPAWRFVDNSFIFLNPDNPFETTFPEIRTVDSLVIDQPNDFVGIKVGDVNNSADPGMFGSIDDRTAGTLWLETTDRAVQSGETIDVHFRTAEAVAGYQYTLEYPGMEVLDIKPGAAMQTDNFAVFPTQAALTTSFNASDPKDRGEFTVRFRALEAGSLNQFLHLSGRITPAKAYTERLDQPMDVRLRFGPTNALSDGFELLPCTPNPFSESTMIGFRLPMATSATLRIFNTAGQLVYDYTADFAAGLHSLPVRKSDLGTNGVFFYQLQTPTESAVRRMIAVDNR